MPATDRRPALPETRVTGVRPRRAQVRAFPGRSDCPASSSKQTPRRSAPLASCLGPGHRPPLRDRGLVALDGPVDRDLGRVAEAVQRERHPPRRAGDPEQAVGQRRRAGQGPALVLVPAVRGRARLQRCAQLRELGLVAPARAPTGPLGGEGPLPADPPGAAPLVHRLRADPQ